MITLPIATTHPSLAKQFNLTLVEANNTDYAFLLIFRNDYLSLVSTEFKAPKPIYVDFLSGKLAHRRRFGGGRGQLIAKAVGLSSKKHPNVLDTTAGFGSDGFVLATLGCSVTMIERSPIVAALLKDGIERAKKAEWFQELSLTLIEDDAIQYLNSLKKLPDVIYLDPMYPIAKKSALVKKEMRMLRKIVGSNADAPKLLSLALTRAKQRVVVKRPRHAPIIEGPKPNLIFEGKSSRYDVYLSK